MTAQAPAPDRRTTVSRRIAADPTSTALLLAGPSALELWPGVRRVAAVGGRVVVEAELPQAQPRSTAATVRALPPRRTPTAYVTRFDWAGPGLPATAGELTLRYATRADGSVATDAVLVLSSSGLDGAAVGAHELQGMAEGFLTNLATAAELRSRAA